MNCELPYKLFVVYSREYGTSLYPTAYYLLVSTLAVFTCMFTVFCVPLCDRVLSHRCVVKRCDPLHISLGLCFCEQDSFMIVCCAASLKGWGTKELSLSTPFSPRHYSATVSCINLFIPQLTSICKPNAFISRTTSNTQYNELTTK